MGRGYLMAVTKGVDLQRLLGGLHPALLFVHTWPCVQDPGNNFLAAGADKQKEKKGSSPPSGGAAPELIEQETKSPYLQAGIVSPELTKKKEGGGGGGGPLL